MASDRELDTPGVIDQRAATTWRCSGFSVLPHVIAGFQTGQEYAPTSEDPSAHAGPEESGASVQRSDGFWSRVAKGPGCWEWQGARHPSGYGSVRFGGIGRSGSVGAHRVAWALTHGPAPRGMHVLHRCDNPPCCNPAHLFLGTHADNMADKAGKGRAPRGSKRSQAKLTEADVIAIRARRAAGESPAIIAKDYGVNRTLVSNIVAGRAWAHVHGGAS